MGHNIIEIYEHTWAIQDMGFGNPSNCYLLEGEKQALLIDTGFGQLDLPAICAGLTSKPIVCVCTHGHMDHVGGTSRFGSFYIHSADMACLRDTSGAMALDEIKSFDLGGRDVVWKLLAGHTQGSIVLFDSFSGFVFDGDATRNPVWLFFPEATDLKSYRDNLDDITMWYRSVGAVGRFGGHINPCEPQSIDIKGLVSCVDAVLAGSLKGVAEEMQLGPRTVKYVRYSLGEWGILGR